ncbi:beta strand repeat-containing protein [Paraburkholderia sp. 31.1]|uniref:beta strand repeat-containing protein n=1 Tax=Paraburkholderia sp. 31.1 TaxID=2615205 RepID=UPI00223B511C|nr:filamentous hemagglutinin N-terminal domain-containing protein [Paraburkholderia sp. 31.1]
MARISRFSQQLAAHDAAFACRRFIRPSGERQAVVRPLWMRITATVMTVVMYFAPAVLLADQTAHGAPIVDPRAPVQFQPTITQTSTAIPAVNITAPNANGLSSNQYSSFNVDSSGLVLNNSLVPGTPLLGGTLGANPNLNGRAATTILNQVNSTSPSTLAGPLEVFGSPASIIISNPDGLSVNGLSLTNAPGLVLTTGVPQFITGPNGSPTSFANAGAVAYSVSSGNVTINGPAGVNGPGAGIDGTVGNIDVIAQTINLNAPLRADQRVNLITGNQLVSPGALNASGTTYGTASNGTANTSAAIGGNGIAIDASQYGSVTSGQIFIVATAAGMGVNQQGALAATAGNVNVNSNGDITVGSTFANQNVNLASVGNTTVSGTGLANQNYMVAANGDINATGSVSAGQNVTLNAGGDLNAASVAAGASANLIAGQSMSLGSVSANALDIEATNGNLTLNSAVTAPGTIRAVAGQNLTVNGAVLGGSTVALTGGQNATVNGSVAGVGDVSLAAQTGTATTTGAVTTNGQLAVAGQQGVSLGGTVSSQGNATITSSAGNVDVGGSLSTPGQIAIAAGQDASVAGQVHSGQSSTITAARDVTLDGGMEVDGTGNASVNAGRDLAGSGAISVANNTALTAGRNLSMTGAIQTGNNLGATAAQNLSVGATTAVGTETLTAAGGSATLGGNALSGGDMTVTAGTDVTAQGSVQTLGNLSVNAQGGNLTATAPVSAAGNATLNAGQTLALGGQATVSGDTTLTGTDITTQGLAVGGNLTATAQNSLDTSAGQLGAAFDANAPALTVNGNATLSGANVTTANAAIGGTYSVAGSTSLTTGGTAAYQGDATLAGGTVTNVGQQMAAGNLTVSGSTVNNQGSLSSLQTMTVNATDLANSGSIYGPTTNLGVMNSTTNTGALLATNALTLTTNGLDNSNGLIFAGDVNNPTSAVGDVTVNVNGGNGTFSNTNGQILGENSLSVNLPNQAIDPSAASMGTLNGGSAFNLSAQAISNTGAWTLPGTAVTVTATQGITNSGTISQGAGTLALNGAVSNSGTVTANDVTINGSLANQTGATVQANDAFTLNGSGTNAGTIEAVNTLNVSGSSYDNSNGTTQAGNSSSPAGSGNVNVNLSGDLTNAGGTLTATNDLAITAANVINSAAGTGATTTTTTTVDNPGLAMGLIVGSDTIDEAVSWGSNGNRFCCNVSSLGTNQVTLADALSVDGVADPTSIDAILGPRSGWSSSNVSPPVTNGNTVTFVEVPTVTGTSNLGNPIIENLWFVETPDNAAQAIATITVALPTATETTTTTGGTAGGTSVIAAGHNVNINASSLNNQGGTVSAGNDASVNVQSLNNGSSVYTSTVTDSIDVASINSFLSQAPSTISLWNTFNGPNGLNGCPFGTAGDCIDPSGIKLAAPGTVTPLSTSSTMTVQGAAGQIVAGHNLNLSGGDLVNAGTLAAGNDVSITANSFTNQGTNTGTMTTTAGCAAGFSGCSPASTTNPNSQTYAYQQINANVTAGHDIVIAANTVSNTYGNLVAANNVVIGGAGTTSTSPTQAASVTNTSGAIAAGNDVDINAATLTNTIAAPVQVHQNYGSATPFGGCGQDCEAYLDVQSANPATITANHDVNLQAGVFSNTGSLVTALNNVTINAASSASSDNQYLNAYWHDNLVSNTWGCAGDASLCSTLYGSAYSSADIQDPAGLPSAVGLPDFVPATIQAGNTLSVNSPTLTNTGNVIGQTVALSGSQLVNGLTDPNVYTPPPVVTGQVITLGPPAVPGSATTTVNAAGQVTSANGQPVSVTGSAGVPAGVPVGVQTVGKPVVPPVQTVTGGAASTPSYLVNSPASLVSGDLSPAALLAALPASLQPGTTQFYYDPYTQAQQVEQAALQATGKASFYSTTSATDSTSQASISNQDTQALYGAALQYAEQNNVALGTQLSAAQLALVNAPMLWYVEQTVPEPGCTATGSGACPTVQALMPEVLLPQNYAAVNADGEISGTDVTLDYASSILNTGTVNAQNLTVNTGTLTNEERSVNVGTIYQYQAELDGNITQTTGTVVQQGGFMSAANYDLNAQAINQIGGALQQVNADGSVDVAGTQALLASLQNQLGGNFTQSTVSDNLTTTVMDQPSAFDNAFMMVVIATISIATSMFGSPVAGAMLDSAMTQLNSGQAFSVANVIETGAITYLTQDVNQYLGLNDFSAVGTNVVSSNAPVTLANLGNLAVQIGEQSVVDAGISTAIEGGSFLTALKDNAVADIAAAGAGAIGADPNIEPGSLESIALHAVLGCGASAALGSGCAGGAIGGAASAALTPYVASAVTGGDPDVTSEQAAAIAAFATFTGGTLAGLAGQNVAGGAFAAQNEAINNCLGHPQTCTQMLSAAAQSVGPLIQPAVGLAGSVAGVAGGALMTGLGAVTLDPLVTGLGIANLYTNGYGTYSNAVNLYNAWNGSTQAALPGSGFQATANYFFPNNQSAQNVAEIADLGLAFASGKVSVSSSTFAPYGTGAALTQEQDLNTWLNSQAAAPTGQYRSVLIPDPSPPNSTITNLFNFTTNTQYLSSGYDFLMQVPGVAGTSGSSAPKK